MYPLMARVIFILNAQSCTRVGQRFPFVHKALHDMDGPFGQWMLISVRHRSYNFRSHTTLHILYSSFNPFYFNFWTPSDSKPRMQLLIPIRNQGCRQQRTRGLAPPANFINLLFTTWTIPSHCPWPYKVGSFVTRGPIWGFCRGPENITTQNVLRNHYDLIH